MVAADLAQLLLDKVAEPDWVVLKPAEMKTESGAKLTVENDGSIVVGAAANTEQQTVRWQAGPQPVRAVRVETSTHAVAPKSGASFFNDYQIVTANMAAGALRGQIVRLDLPGDSSEFPRHPADKGKKTINLAELQVFRGDQNIALRKKARQSSTAGDARVAPEGAVDGNTDGNDGGNPYAHTGMEEEPWWEVDLGSEQVIDRIVIWNRSDTNLYARMRHFRIRVLDHSRKVVLEQVIDKAPSPSAEIVPQSLLAKKMFEAGAEHQPLIVPLPHNLLKGSPARFRVSVATRFTSPGLVDQREQLMKTDDVETRLAVAYALDGRNDLALHYFGNALQQADGYEARKPILELAARFDDLFSALVKRQPNDPQVQLALARSVGRGASSFCSRSSLRKRWSSCRNPARLSRGWAQTTRNHSGPC